MIPGVTPLLLGVLGVLALAGAAGILLGFGSRYRVGRLLAAAPRVSVAEAIALAATGEERYVRVTGRIDGADEFEDEHHRPLVFRRTTVQTRASGGRWTTLSIGTEAVPFVVREGLDELDVARDDLAEGVVVVPRIRRGRLAEIVAARPSDAPADADGQVVIQQVSNVEHGTIVGVPRRGSDGKAVIGAGLGRPLILTTLEQDEAMRVLTGGATGRARVAIVLLAGGAMLVAFAVVLWLLDSLFGKSVAAALAASPDPSLRPGSDTRSSGQGPGLVGEPALAILGMVGIGLVSLVATLAYVRLTGGRGGSDEASGAPRRRPR
jgi:hypothetical protein